MVRLIFFIGRALAHSAGQKNDKFAGFLGFLVWIITSILFPPLQIYWCVRIVRFAVLLKVHGFDRPYRNIAFIHCICSGAGSSRRSALETECRGLHSLIKKILRNITVVPVEQLDSSTKKQLRSVVISDPHNRHERLHIPDCDVLVLAGDFTNHGLVRVNAPPSQTACARESQYDSR
jgi:hypothetical protein